jgi:hypothetical protein
MLADLGVDPHDKVVIADLAAVGIVLLAWRNGPVEDWHAVPLNRISDAEMMRASIATTRLVREVIVREARAEDAGEGVDAFTIRLIARVDRVLGDPDRRVPDGRSLPELVLSGIPNADECRSGRQWRCR